MFPLDLTDEQTEKIRGLRVFGRYFETMRELEGFESTSFTMPTQHERIPWEFWIMLRDRATQYDELSASTITEIVERAVGRPEGDAQAELFYKGY